MAKYKLEFYSCKKQRDETIYFDNRSDFEALKNALLKAVYIKDLKAFSDSKIKIEQNINAVSTKQIDKEINNVCLFV